MGAPSQYPASMATHAEAGGTECPRGALACADGLRVEEGQARQDRRLHRSAQEVPCGLIERENGRHVHDCPLPRRHRASSSYDTLKHRLTRLETLKSHGGHLLRVVDDQVSHPGRPSQAIMCDSRWAILACASASCGSVPAPAAAAADSPMFVRRPVTWLRMLDTPSAMLPVRCSAWMRSVVSSPA